MMRSRDSQPSERGLGLLIPGLLLAAAGLALLVGRLILNEWSFIGAASGILIVLSGVALAWKSLRRRSRDCHGPS